MRNFSEYIHNLSNIVLPNISKTGQRYGTKSETNKAHPENGWPRKLKIAKRETANILPNNDIIYPEQGRLGCMQGRKLEGSLPESKIPLDTAFLDAFKNNMSDMNIRNTDGLTPLMLAAATSNNAEEVRSLLSNGAMVDLQDKEGNTALMWVVRSLHKLTSSALISAKLAIIDVLKMYNANVDLQGTAGFTPLMITALSNNVEAFKKMKSGEINLNLQNNAGDTVLHLAVRFCKKGEILPFLMRNTLNSLLQNNDGHSPFMLASFQGRKKIMDYFIKNGANINEKDKKEWSALMHATNCNYEKTAIYLLNENANALYKNSRNESAKTIAMAKRNKDLFMLIKRKEIEYHEALFRKYLLDLSGLSNESYNINLSSKDKSLSCQYRS